MAKRKPGSKTPPPRLNVLDTSPTPPPGYAYVHIYRNGRTAVLSWREVKQTAGEGRHVYDQGSAEALTRDQIRAWAADYLGIPKDNAHAINVVGE